MDDIDNLGIWLLQTCFMVYGILLMMRILLPDLTGQYHNSIAQFILKATSPLVLPLRRFLRYHGHIDVAAVMVLLLLALVHRYLRIWLQTGYWLGVSSGLIATIGDLVHLMITLFFWSIVIDAILSWIETQNQRLYEVKRILEQLTNPLLSPLRRFIPRFWQVDFTPIIALLLLKVIDVVIVY